MALPNSIDPATPVDSNSPGLGAGEFRSLKQYIIDVFGLPSATNVTAAAFSISTGGIVTISQVDPTFKNVILTQGTITTDSPLLNATSTWNASGVTFTAIKADVTDTASAAASKLIDLQVGAASKFSVDKSGNLIAVGTGAITGALTAASLTVTGALSGAALTATSIAATGTVALTDDMTITDAKNIVLNATTGTKIGTATSQKLAFFNSTPIVQPVGTTDLRTALINLGLYATGGASPLDLNGGAFTAGSIAGTGTVALTGAMTISDAIDIVLNATTGTKIGTAVTEKLGFWNATPVVQPAAAGQADQGVMTTVGANTGTAGAGLSLIGNTSTIDQSAALMNDLVALEEDILALDTLLTEIRTALVNTGIMKGAA